MFKSKKKGFTLVELVLVISAGLIISFTAFQTMTKKQELLRADIVGQQIKDVGEAVNVYIANHYNQLSTLTNATGTADDAGPRTCNTVNQNCTITTATLSNEGLLPPTFSGKNAYNSTYTILLKRGGVSPYFTISGLVTTTDPWKGAANAIRYDWLGTAMQAAGLDSGMTRDIGTRVNGYNGQWVADSATYSNITQLGQLAYLTGYGSNSYSVYLRRDGVLPMTGQLNMSGNDINGAKNITASANIKANGTIAGGVVTSESNVSAKNGYGDTISMGGDSSGNDYELYMSTAGKPLSIYNSATGGSPSTTNKSTTLLKVSGAIESGDINSVGDVNAGNWLTAKNGLGNTMRIGGDATGDYDIVFDPSSNSNNSVGFFSTNSAVPLDFLFRGTITATNTAGTARGVFLDGNKGEVIANSWVSGKNGYGDTISMGGDALSNDYEIKLGADKPLSIYSPNKVGNPVIFQVQGASSLNGDTKINGNLTSSGNMTASGNIAATGNVSGDYLQATSQVAVGGTCASNGLMSKDSAGFVLSCQSGKWQRQFNPAVIIRNDGIWAANSDFQACNSDEVVVGGGGQCEEPSSHYIHYSAPSNNGWSIDCFQANPVTGVDKGSLTYAICMKK